MKMQNVMAIKEMGFRVQVLPNGNEYSFVFTSPNGEIYADTYQTESSRDLAMERVAKRLIERADKAA